MELNKSSLNNVVKNLENKIEELNTQYNNVKKSIENLKNAWNDDISKPFYDAVENEYLKKLKSAIEALNEYNTFINGVPVVYDTLDKSYSEKEIEV